MKVFLAVPDYHPSPRRLGAWLATSRYATHLADLGHQVTAAPFAYRGRTLVIDGVEVRAMTHTERIDAAADHDVVVHHAGDRGAGYVLGRHAGRPVITFVHGAGHGALDPADLIVFNSENLRAASPQVAPSIVCHPPVFVDEWQVDRSGADCITIVNLSREKGVDTAWMVAERMPLRRFLGVRGGYGDQRIPRARNFEVLANQPDMRQVYARTRILLMPSAHETWGMVGVEAMCSGIPVIAHPTAGLLESLGPAGIFVDRDDVDGWVRAIENLDDPDCYAAASAAARARAVELDPVPNLARFAAAVEQLVGVAA